MTEGWLAAFGVAPPLPPETDALKAEIKRLREIVYNYVDPFDVTPEDEDFVRAAVNAVLQEYRK